MCFVTPNNWMTYNNDNTIYYKYNISNTFITDTYAYNYSDVIKKYINTTIIDNNLVWIIVKPPIYHTTTKTIKITQTHYYDLNNVCKECRPPITSDKTIIINLPCIKEYGIYKKCKVVKNTNNYNNLTVLNKAFFNDYVSSNRHIYLAISFGQDGYITFPSLEATEVIVNDEIKHFNTDYTVNTTDGVVTFLEAPSSPLTDGQDNVKIIYGKTITGYADRIKKCTLLTVFDNRVFFSGNQDYPNTVWHSSLNDPSYCSDLDYYNEGLDLSPVKSMVAGNNALWVFKMPSQANTTVFYHNPVIDSEYGKIYPSTHSSISIGCIAAGINFNDDIVFFSDRGMEAINGDITTEQVLSHRSSLIDSKLLTESNYKSMILEEYEGYLLVIIGNKIYLADSRTMFTNENHTEYEWFYWEITKEETEDETTTTVPVNITCTQVKDGILYLGTAEGIYSLTNTLNSRQVQAYWTTPEDEFKYPQYQKTTNKRGCVIDMNGTEIAVSVKTDNDVFKLINTYNTTRDYVVARIKKKKWKSIQLKFSSTKPFKLYSSTLESYVGGYVKR